MKYVLDFIGLDRRDLVKITQAEPLPIPRKSEVVWLHDGRKDLGLFTVFEVLYYYRRMTVTAMIFCSPAPELNDEPQTDQNPPVGQGVIPPQVQPKKKRETTKRKR